MNTQDHSNTQALAQQEPREDTLPADSSGFVQDIGQEASMRHGTPGEQAFSGLAPIYVSRHGHARLFEARRYGKLYTLKCLKEDFLLSAPYRQALAKEFDIGLQLDHPGICRTLGMEEVDTLGQAIVMEHIDGETLEARMSQGKLTAELADKVAHQLAEAIDYMHNKQILHRDLKPSNIMLTFNGNNTKLIDFSLSDSDGHCVLKMPAGTTRYMAPEITAKGYRPNMKADIYSFGMVLRDMAQAAGDRHLARCARLCTRQNPDERPESACEALAHRQSYLSTLLLPMALTLCCVTLAVLALLGIRHRQAGGQELLQPDGNEVSPTLVQPSPGTRGKQP